MCCAPTPTPTAEPGKTEGNHQTDLSTKRRAVSWLPGLSRTWRCVLMEARGALKAHLFCFTPSAGRLKRRKRSSSWIIAPTSPADKRQRSANSLCKLSRGAQGSFKAAANCTSASNKLAISGYYEASIHPRL